MQGETLLEKELRTFFAQGSCRRDKTFRYLHTIEEFQTIGRLGEKGTPATARNVRNRHQ